MLATLANQLSVKLTPKKEGNCGTTSPRSNRTPFSSKSFDWLYQDRKFHTRCIGLL